MRPGKSSFGIPPALWTQRREASLNWLALGLLLAAWNAVDEPGSAAHADSGDARSPDMSADHAGPAARRPDPLRRYSCVTVRSMTRTAAAEP
jgi:hypothetical protein